MASEGRHRAQALCTQCGLPAAKHCDMDEPGLDHPYGCAKMHHEFKAALAAAETPPQGWCPRCALRRWNLSGACPECGTVLQDRDCDGKAVRIAVVGAAAEAPLGSETPRRVNTWLWTPEERLIDAARKAVENMAADVRLTDAVVLLGAALDSVADYVDGIKPMRRVVRTEGWHE